MYHKLRSVLRPVEVNLIFFLLVTFSYTILVNLRQDEKILGIIFLNFFLL